MNAFGELVERHHQRVLNLAYRLSSDAELARDIAQDCFLRLHRAAGQYHPRGRFIAYICSLTRNLVLDSHRRRQRRQPVAVDHLDYYLQTGATTTACAPEAPDKLLERKRRQQRLFAALESLPQEQRSVFILSEIEGLSYAEIGAICDCPDGTVASRKHHAVLKLQQLLAAEGSDG